MFIVLPQSENIFTKKKRKIIAFLKHINVYKSLKLTKRFQ